MVITNSQDGSTMTGRQMLEWVLVSEKYDPRVTYTINEQLFSTLDSYEFPYLGARTLVINVATGLFVEAHGLVPWSLQDYSAEEINSLFIEADSVTFSQDGTLDHGKIPPDMVNLQSHWYPVPDKMVEDAHYKQFNLAHRLAEGATTQQEAIEQLIVWFQQNFFHAIEPDYTWEVYLDGREPLNTGGAVAYPLTIERIYEERVAGCHEPTIILEGMLHSLNVPAVPLSVHGHGVLYLPTLDRYVHGDHILGGTNVPPEMRLYTPDEFRPFAEDKAWIFQIAKDKYQVPLPMILIRDGDCLHIYQERVYPFPDTSKCIEVSDEEWNRMAEQVTAYNVQYDTENCIISSDMVVIRTLPELTAPE
jgi:hypothetical protein